MALPKLETPTYQLTLPSTGDVVVFRPFLVKEHKILLSMVDASDDEVVRIIKELIDVCTFNKLNVNNLPHFDLEYIFMKLRSKSISEIVDVVVTCANCSEQYDASFSIEDLKIEGTSNSKNIIKLTDKISIQLKYPLFESIVNLSTTNDPTKSLSVIKDCMVGIYDEDIFYDINDQADEEVEEFMNSLTKEQFKNIEHFFVTSPKVVQEFESTCSKCSSVNNSRIEGIQNFFV